MGNGQTLRIRALLLCGGFLLSKGQRKEKPAARQAGFNAALLFALIAVNSRDFYHRYFALLHPSTVQRAQRLGCGRPGIV